MKYVVMAALLMAGVATYAQEPVKPQAIKAPKERLTSAQKADKLAADLELNSDQRTKVQAIYDEQEKKFNEVQDKYKGPKDEAARKAWVEEIRANREQLDASMKKVLTEEQYTKWQTSRKVRAGAMQGNVLKQKQIKPVNGELQEK